MTISDALAVFGRLHPLVLHVPIGVLAGAALLQFVSLLRPQLGLRPAVGVLLWLAALVAAATASSGWVLAREDGYGGDTLDLHRWIGIALAAATIVTAILHARASKSMMNGAAYGVVFLATLVLLVPAGHLGGTLTHGEGFITAPLFASSTDEAGADTKAPARTVFARTIQPTLEATCANCHNAKKRKGGLSFESEQSLVDGGRNGPVIVPGDITGSELVRRLRLPLDDEDHMPPEGKRQPSEAEIAAIEAWVAAGASFTDETGGAALVADGDRTPNAASASKPTASTVPAQPAGDAHLEALRAALVHAEPVAPDSPLLWIDFAAPASAGKADDAFVATLLRPLAAHVDDLSLGGSGVTDATLELLATMPNLRRLDLRGTAVTDAGIAKLRDHRSLAEISLVRTRVGDASIDALTAMPALHRVFLWSSAITPEGLQRLRDGRRGLLADAGDAPDSKALEAEPVVKLGAAPPPAQAAAPTTAPTTAAALKPLNTVCPVSGSPIDPKYTILYDGKVIGFCCPNCPKKFWENPAACLANLK